MARCRKRPAPVRPKGRVSPGAARKRVCDAARAGAVGNPAGHRRISARARENAKKAGFDGGAYPRRQWLSARPVPAGFHQSSAATPMAAVWSKARPPDAGSHRRGRARCWGPERVGMHLAPRMDSHDMGDSNRLGTFTYVGRELGKRGNRLDRGARSTHRSRHQTGGQPGPPQGRRASRQYRPAR